MPNKQRYTNNASNPLLKTINATSLLMENPTSTDRNLNVQLFGDNAGTTTKVAVNASGHILTDIEPDPETGLATAANQTNGNQICKAMGSEDGSTGGTQRQLHVDGSGNLQTNVVNTINTAPANSANSHITDDPTNTFAVGMKGRTTIGTATTETFLLCDTDGHLQVDVLSGAGSSDATASNQSTMITKLGEIDTAQDLTNTKLDTIDGVLDSILVDTTLVKNQQLLQTSHLALHQTGTTNTTITVADGGSSTTKEVSLSDIRAAIVEPSGIAYHITSTGSAGSGTDIDMEVSLDGSTFITLPTNIVNFAKSATTGNLGDDAIGLPAVGEKFKFKISNNSGGSANYTVDIFAYGMDFAQAN